MKIVVLDGYTLNPGDNPWTAVEALGETVVYERTSAEDVVDRAAGADVLVINKVRLSGETLIQLPRLRFIAVTATGYDCVDIESARKRGIAVANVPVYGTDSVAQYVFALLLHHCHRVAHHADRVRDGEWARRNDFCFWDYPLKELAGKTIGIVGFGRIGRRTGEIAHAFGMRVVAHDRHEGEPPSYSPFGWRSLEALAAEADVLSLHCNLTPENRGMVNADLLARMKRESILINTSRGGLVVDADLAEALNGGRIGGAALDVVSVEPIDGDNPLLRARNCTITPHLAWATLEARQRLMATTASNIAAFVGGTAENVVN